MVHMVNLVGIFVPDTHLAKTGELEVMVGCVLIYIYIQTCLIYMSILCQHNIIKAM